MAAFIFLFFSVLIGVVMFCGGFHFFVFFGFDRCCDVLWWLSFFFVFFFRF